LSTSKNLNQKLEERKQHKETNETEALKELDVCFNVENLKWPQFLEKLKERGFPKLEVVPLDFQIHSDQFLIKEYISSGINKLTIVNPNFLVPYIGGSLDVKTFIYNTSPHKFYEKGIVLVQTLNNLGLFCFMPFSSGKKIYGYYKRETIQRTDSKRSCFFYTNSSNPELPINNVSYNEDIVTFNKLEEPLTENQHIRIENNGAKFKKVLVESESNTPTLSYMLFNLDKMLSKTIDPSYMEKIINLNKEISCTE